MITIRFPTGVAVQYNDAAYVIRSTEYTDLYKQDGKVGWVAQVPNTCIVEVTRPCRVYNTNHEPGSIVDALNRMIGDQTQRRLLPTYELAELKQRLTAFNGKRKDWSGQ